LLLTNTGKLNLFGNFAFEQNVSGLDSLSVQIACQALPCVFDGMSAMETRVKVSGAELKAQIEKVFTTQELRAALNYMVKMLSEDGAGFPCWMEGIIIERLRNAGVDLKKYGRWYSYIAAYAILPKMEEIIDLERKYAGSLGSGEFNDDEIIEKWVKLIGQSANITYLELETEFKDIT